MGDSQKDQNQDLTNFFSVSLDFMCIANAHGEFERVNQALINRLGYSESELIGQKIIDFVHGDDLIEAQQQLAQLYYGFDVRGIINRFKCKDGNYVALKWNCAPDAINKKLYAVARDLTEQEATDKKLKTLSRIACETDNGVVITDVDQNIQWVNDGFTRITGFSFDEVVGKKPSHFLQGKETSLSARGKIATAIKNQQPFNIELINYKKNGEPYWIGIDCNPLFDESGKIEGFMALETDVTDKKNSQLELSKKTKLLEQMSQHGKIGAWEVDLENESIYWSDTTREIHGVDKYYIPNMAEAVKFYKEGESRNTIQKIFNTCVLSGEPWHYECQLVNRQGEDVWVASTGQAEIIDGKCVRVFGSFQDINERKINQLIKLRALRYSQTLESLTVSSEVIVGDLEKSLPNIVKACSKALGVSRVSVWFFKPEDNLIECASLYNACSDELSHGMTLHNQKYPHYISALKNKKIISAHDVYLHADLQEFIPDYVESLNITSMLDVPILGDGSFFGVICLENTHERYNWNKSDESFIAAVATLISSVCDRKMRKETEVELLGAIDKANEAVKTKSEFLASMSHEIRTPMNGIIGMLRSVIKTTLTQEQQRKIKVAKKSADSLLNIINDILDFSKIDAGKMEFENVNFNLIEFMHDFYEEMKYTAAEKNILFSVNTDQVQQRYLIGDTVRLKQILTNLAANAFKFTAQGFVTITLQTKLHHDGSHCLIGQVEDSGIGIDSSKLESLFDVFTQVDASTTREYGGTGLGLSIVRQLCEKMHGKVSVKSKLKQGSTFTFDVILKSCEKYDVQKKSIFQPLILEKSAYVLLVEDNRVNQEVAKDLLSDFNIQADIADNGQIALNMLLSTKNKTPYGAILMDCQMPILDGYDATKKIRKGEAGMDHISIPIIAMTANAMKGDRRRCLAAGMDDYISKPVDPNALHDALCRWLPDMKSESSQSLLNVSAIPSDTPAITSHTHHIWDEGALLKRVNNRPDRVQSLVRLFKDDSTKLIAQIAEHIHRHHLSEVAQCCHSLKGVSSNLSAPHITARAETLEKYCKKDPADITSLALDALFKDLKGAHGELLSVLDKV